MIRHIPRHLAGQPRRRRAIHVPRHLARAGAHSFFPIIGRGWHFYKCRFCGEQYGTNVPTPTCPANP